VNSSAGKEVTTAKSVFMKQFQQKLAFHLPAALVKKSLVFKNVSKSPKKVRLET
jgi:hypothetical protein